MFTVRELDNRLALKLGDPVTNNGTGELFDLEQRINYLSRAYGRLIRMLKQIMGSYAPQFANTIQYAVRDLEPSGNGWGKTDFSSTKTYLEKVLESYLIVESEKGETSLYSVINIPAEKWLSTMHGENDLQSPDLSKGIIYGTIINNTYCVLPFNKETKSVKMLYVSSPKYFESNTQGMNEPVNISSEYVDMLLTLAAAEGMADAARSDKFQMFVADVNNQITALANYINLQLQLEGKHSGK